MKTEFLPHEIPFDISWWPHRFIGSMIPDRPLVYFAIPKAFSIYGDGYMPTRLWKEDGKWRMNSVKDHVVEMFASFVNGYFSVIPAFDFLK